MYERHTVIFVVGPSTIRIRSDGHRWNRIRSDGHRGGSVGRTGTNTASILDTTVLDFGCTRTTTKIPLITDERRREWDTKIEALTKCTGLSTWEIMKLREIAVKHGI